MGEKKIEKLKSYNLPGISAYVAHTIVHTTIVRASTGIMRITAVDAGEEIAKNISPFDIIIQVIDGAAQVLIENHLYLVHTGELIIVPAHALLQIKAQVRFKMLSTLIKSGYEDCML